MTLYLQYSLSFFIRTYPVKYFKQGADTLPFWRLDFGASLTVQLPASLGFSLSGLCYVIFLHFFFFPLSFSSLKEKTTHLISWMIIIQNIWYYNSRERDYIIAALAILFNYFDRNSYQFCSRTKFPVAFLSSVFCKHWIYKGCSCIPFSSQIRAPCRSSHAWRNCILQLINLFYGQKKRVKKVFRAGNV